MLTEKEMDELQIKTCREMGNRIRDLIIESEFSESEVSEILGYGPKTITRIINGTTTANVNQLIELADLFGTSPSYILEGIVPNKVVIPKKDDVYTLKDLHKRKIINDELYIQFLESKILEICKGGR